MRRPESVVAGVAVLVAVSAALATGQDTSELVSPATQAESVPLTSQTLGCPESPPGPRQSGIVRAVTPSGDQAPTGSGVLELTEVEDDAQQPLASVDVPGDVAQFETRRSLRSVLVTARGALAPGVSAAAYVESDTAERRGLEAVRCDVPRDDWWFVGVDTSAAATSRLVLVNPTPAVAVVSLHVHGPQGIVATPSAQGIPVGAHTSQVIDLAGDVPGLDAATVHVEATRGLIVPAVHVQRFTATASLGSDWLQPGEPPATEVMVEPTAPGAGARTLLITNTGAGGALVQGRVLDEDGAFKPPKLTDLRIAPGATRAVELDDIVGRSAVAVQLSSNVAVAAGILTQQGPGGGGGDGRADLASSATAAPLAGSAALPVPPEADLAVVLATLRPGGSRADVTWHARSGEQLGSEVVSLARTGVTVWELPRSQAERAAYVVVTPRGDSSIQAVLAASSEAGLTTVPFVVSPRTLTRPAVRPAGP